MRKKLKEKVVILITIDALRADHLKSYGYYRNTAPNLESFIQKGSIFKNAISNGPETPSSFSAIFTSTLPFLDCGYSPLPNEKIPFPKILNEKNIFCYGIHSNPNLGSDFNYHKGFNVFLDGERYKFQNKTTIPLNLKQKVSYYIKKILNYRDFTKKISDHLVGLQNIKNFLIEKLPSLFEILLPFIPITYNAPFITNKICNLILNKRGDLFLWAHYMDTHSPFKPSRKHLKKFRKERIPSLQRAFLNRTLRYFKNYKVSIDDIEKLKDLYDGEINFLDYHLKRLFDLLSKRYNKQNCLIIITADHGESFYEHEFFHHQGNIYDELLKVPLYIVDFGRKSSKKYIDTTVELLDVAPTILDYFEIKIPEYFQGKSLLPLIKGENQEERKYVISECYQKNGWMKRNNTEGYILISIRNERMKYIYNEEKKKEYLFNLEKDPLEKINIANQSPLISEFQKIRDDHLREVKLKSEKSLISDAIQKIQFKKIL